MRLRVPGNLLIAGEYAVLEPGGLGLILAVDVPVVAEAVDAEELRITGIQGTTSMRWRPGDAPEAGGGRLFAEVARECARERARELGGRLPALDIRVDSSAHLYPDGRKRGLGSSAAVCVALSALLLGEGADKDAVFRVALAAHRRVQGGRGSGYDVAASVFGGLALFVGGSAPRIEGLPFRGLPNFALVRGPGAVSTVSSVAAYETWKRGDPEGASRFLAASDGIVRSLAEGTTAEERVRGLDRAAALGRYVGAAIGVSADMGAVRMGEGAPGGGVKALGAGNELGLAYSLYPLSGEGLRAAKGGFEWSER